AIGEQDLRPLGERCLRPRPGRLVRDFDDLVDGRRGGEVDLAADHTGRRVVNLAGPLRHPGPRGSTDKMGDSLGTHSRIPCFVISSVILSRMNVLDSRARSSHAKTQVVTVPLKPAAAREAKSSSKSTSPWPMSRCWCTRTVDPGGLTM